MFFEFQALQIKIVLLDRNKNQNVIMEMIRLSGLFLINKKSSSEFKFTLNRVSGMFRVYIH